MTFLQVANSIFMLVKSLQLRGDVKITIELEDKVEKDKLIGSIADHMRGQWPGVETPPAIRQMLGCQPFTFYGVKYQLTCKPERRSSTVSNG